MGRDEKDRCRSCDTCDQQPRNVDECVNVEEGLILLDLLNIHTLFHTGERYTTRHGYQRLLHPDMC